MSEPGPVRPPLHLDLRILDHVPAHPSGAQLWEGGATDLATRTMIAAPPLHRWTLEKINPGALPSPENAGGVILVSMNVDRAHEDEFNDWYDMEHIPHLSRLAGVIAARRFRATLGYPRYVALYHVESSDIYATPGWMAANQTPWMLRMRRFQRDRIYFMFRRRIA